MSERPAQIVNVPVHAFVVAAEGFDWTKIACRGVNSRALQPNCVPVPSLQVFKVYPSRVPRVGSVRNQARPAVRLWRCPSCRPGLPFAPPPVF
jgi:hypothetical protein